MTSPVTELQHHLLVATPKMADPMFAETVIFLAHHGTDGGMGFVINQPLPRLEFAEVARSMGIEELLAEGRARPAQPPIMFRGGPVETTRGFVIHTPDYALKSSVKMTEAFTLSAQADIVTDIARGIGPQRMNFCLGYAGWAPGQLEQEILNNDWVLLPATPELVFDTAPEHRYPMASRRLGLNPLTFHGDIIGRA